MANEYRLTSPCHCVEYSWCPICRSCHQSWPSGAVANIQNFIVVSSQRVDTSTTRDVPYLTSPIDRPADAQVRLVVELCMYFDWHQTRGNWPECWRFHHCVLPEYGCNARSWHPRLLPYGQKTLSWLFDLVYQSSNWQFRLYDQAAYVDILQTPHPIVLRYYPSSQLRQENHWGWMTSTQSLWRDHGRYDKDPRYQHSKFCRFYLRKVSKLTSKEGQGKYQKSPWLSYYPRGCWKQLHRLHFDVLLTSIALLQSRFARFCKFYHSSRWWICRPVCWRHNLSKAEYVHGES